MELASCTSDVTPEEAKFAKRKARAPVATAASYLGTPFPSQAAGSGLAGPAAIGCLVLPLAQQTPPAYIRPRRRRRR